MVRNCLYVNVYVALPMIVDAWSMAVAWGTFLSTAIIIKKHSYSSQLQILSQGLSPWLRICSWLTLQRFYKMLIIGVLSFNITPISTFSGAFVIVRYRNACLRLFVVLLQDLHCLQRFYHNVDH